MHMPRVPRVPARPKCSRGWRMDFLQGANSANLNSGNDVWLEAVHVQAWGWDGMGRHVLYKSEA